jgi:ribosomal protein S20
MEKKNVNISMNDIADDKFFEWFFLTSIYGVGNNNSNDEKLQEFINSINDNCMETAEGQVHNIKMFINDIEVNPIEAIKELQNQYEDQVDKAAKKLLSTKYSSIVEKLVKIEDILDVE